MKTSEARHLVEKAFTHKFSEAQFTTFIHNLLPGIEEPSTKIVTNAQVPKGFREHVDKYTRIGTYVDDNNDVIDVVIVQLKESGELDRARSRQRNMMAHYLNKRNKDAVLVAYICEETDEWRFSFVRLAYKTKVEKDGHVRVGKAFTPARRFSFLVGEHEPNHTAQQQLGDLLTQNDKPTLSDIEKAFNIESVTKAFFTHYKELFLEIKDNLDAIAEKDPLIKAEFEKCAIETANFAKKLLGQIVFLYFLQKKGWLGVRDGNSWGSGDKQFLYHLFQEHKNVNFFDEILEPFFYEALAIERPRDDYPTLQVKVPFLNGGLFEPLQGYNWQKTHINLDNKVFKHVFDVFNLYNFTVREDEPLEKEVAVDPEMLGKVFENLLEVKDRKSKGAFYTPREIVHYMCQESLINYLYTALNEGPITYEKVGDKQLNLIGNKGKRGQLDIQIAHEQPEMVSKKAIAFFIREGEASAARDEARENGDLKNDDFSLPESIRKYAEAIDRALADVMICDPAIGSGAFPVGMMNEIVRARTVLTPYLNNLTMRDTYDFKWHCIESSLYGVDIDPSAIEIAKLRLWLSLVVDEKSYEGIRPLPNLDYRIICGNSLLSVEKNLFNYSIYPQIEQKKNQYFSTTSARNKKILKNEIESLINQLTNSKQLFDFEVYFSEIFSGKNGFDIVIGNPPYVSAVEHSKADNRNRKEYRKLFPPLKGSYDLYTVFLLLGEKITNEFGQYCWIIPNKFLVSDYASDVKKYLIKNGLYASVDVSTFDVFDGTGVYPIIIFGSKKTKREFFKYEIERIEDLLQNQLIKTKPIILENNAKFKDFGIKISSGTTGYQARSIIPLISETPRDGAIPFIVSGSIDKYKINYFDVQYMKHKFRKAYISNGDQIADSKWRFWTKEKIIIAGMTKEIEAVYSEEPIALGVGVYAIYDFGGFSPYYLLGILNSTLLTHYLREKFKDKHLAGGYLAINKSTIHNLPLIRPNKKDELFIEEIVKRILEKPNSLNRPSLEGKINEKVYEIFGLSKEDIKLVVRYIK